MDSVKADHGFTMDHPSVRNLLQYMSEFSAAERRDFLQFTTGSPKLPIGGQYLPILAHEQGREKLTLPQDSRISRPCSLSSVGPVKLPTRQMTTFQVS